MTRAGRQHDYIETFSSLGTTPPLQETSTLTKIKPYCYINYSVQKQSIYLLKSTLPFNKTEKAKSVTKLQVISDTTKQ